MDRVIYKIISVIFAFAIALCVNAQDEIDDFDMDIMESYAYTPAEYLIVSVSGTGNVSFESPEKVKISASGYKVTKELKIGSCRVPGQGPLVKFTINRDAKVSTSDKQIYDMTAGISQLILIANENAPAISITFAN